MSVRPERLVPGEALAELRAVLETHFPLLFGRVAFERVSESGGLLGLLKGSTDQPPLILMAHQDVVDPGDATEWTHAPFAGDIVGGRLWARGALDCKGILVAICAAAEELLASGALPRRDVWFSFGSNEEVSGDAAPAAVARLQALGVVPWLVLDEGGAIVTEALPGVRGSVAVVGVAEKGTTDVELVVQQAAGPSHASTPPKLGATARLARAIWRLERHREPVRIPAPSVEMFERLAAASSAPYRWVYANARVLARPLARVLAALGGEPAAIVHTTVAVTRLSGAPGQNVIASEARAGVNIRVAIGDTATGVVDRLRRAVGDKSVQLRELDMNDPSAVAPTDAEQFAAIARVTEQVFPGTLTVPYVMLGASDARFFHRAWPHVYRFSPIRMTAAQRASVHGPDENIGLTDLDDAVRWYREFLEV